MSSDEEMDPIQELTPEEELEMRTKITYAILQRHKDHEIEEQIREIISRLEEDQVIDPPRREERQHENVDHFDVGKEIQ